MHGIERASNTHGPPRADNGISRVVIHYSDGRSVNVVPDAGRDVFTEDDIRGLKQVLDSASSKAEWAKLSQQTGD